ncbi:curli production assembly/transport protein CsgG [Halomonas sp. ATCH28]|uniref:Curli production assembly/transport component CsgG n=1 Tax=Halomonas gemina TaxID=2945105 RepID=A0ABT0T5W9_9GAMM|nr:CsgG/HfaB family protein [Halomonas gemina]MCL7942304.1 curli production assembly/transport protein CsgG [Halomonas gemina]
MNMWCSCIQTKTLVFFFLLWSVTGCTASRMQPFTPQGAEQPDLRALPPPQTKVVVAVYDFPDLTGQHRETETGQAHYSRAVSQGGAAVLIRALQDAGQGEWFTVVERKRLANVLTERQIIRDQRRGRVDRNGMPLPPPQALLYAGAIFEGGIIGYDTNTLTGGAGARFLGVGASTQYREDVVTVFLRAVSSQTGEIWNTVVAAQRIYSVQSQGDVFRFVGSDEILELEAGFTRNSPRLVALRRAVEQAVYSMVMEGAERGLWAFANPVLGEVVQRSYLTRHPNEKSSLTTLVAPMKTREQHML